MTIESVENEFVADPSAIDAHEREAREWLANVYQGDTVRQLSFRSIVTGMIIGGVMSISNLYVGLKTGWSLGVTITACIIAFAMFRTLETVFNRFRRDPFTILENYTMSSAASAAGYMASAGLVSAIPALYLTTGRVLLWWEMMVWLGAVSVLGVFMAVPLKRQLINIDKLPFPSGIATAETLKSMHSAGKEAMQKARALLFGGLLGGIVAVWRDGIPLIAEWLTETMPEGGKRLAEFAIPENIPLLPGAWGNSLLKRTSVGFEGSMIMIAAGAIMGIRVGTSLLLGAIVYYGLIGPELIDRGIVKGEGYRAIVAWTLWPATAMMVTSGLLSFAMRWRTVLRAFRGMAAMFSSEGRGANDPLERVEVPGSWFVIGTVASGAACVMLGHWLFDITWWMGILAVLLTFVLSIVAARATGETDITPIGALGKITQLTYGVIAPSNMTTNLMTASITAGASSHSADLLTDLKSGYLLGGNARKQTISQLFGVLAGTLVCVPAYTLIADPEKLGSEQLPAPAAKVWAGVAEMLANGIDQLPQGALLAMAVGGLIGIVITLAEATAPARYRQWIPSATGLGIAGVVPAFNSISMFLGALAAWILAKRKPAVDEAYTIPVSSGLIAGESLMGVAIIFSREAPGIVSNLWR
jgi:OPT family oligopeptide transporter